MGGAPNAPAGGAPIGGEPGGDIGPSIVCWNAMFAFGAAIAGGAASGGACGAGMPGGAPGGGPPGGAPGPAGGLPPVTPVIIIVPLNFDAAAFGLSGD